MVRRSRHKRKFKYVCKHIDKPARQRYCYMLSHMWKITGVCKAQHCCRAEKGDFPNILCTGTRGLSAACSFWVPQQKEDIKLLKSVQRRAKKMMKGLEGGLKSSLSKTAWFIQPGAKWWEPHHSLQLLREGKRRAGADFSLVTSDTTKRNCMRQCWGA